MSDCKFLEITDLSCPGGDIFDHPNYSYKCLKKDKDIYCPFITCKKCLFYEGDSKNGKI